MIEFQEVSKVFSGHEGREVVAVDRVSLRVREGETVCLIGTSGSGKTTCMKMVNRLIEPTSGAILVGGERVQDQNPIRLRRQIGYVIQKAGLLPHLTVARNIGLLCKLEGWSKDKIRSRVDLLLDLVNLPPDQYRSRFPLELSGGQQQRVGVARALALDPGYILMDEPFGALDPITRNGLHDEFLRLKEEVKKTTILVTHDLSEAFKLGDRIALLRAGKLVQIGTEDDFRYRPESEFVKDFVQNHVNSLQLTVADAAIEGACDSQAEPLLQSDPLRAALMQFLKSDIRELPVVSTEGDHVGRVTRESVRRCLE
jgi:osmoprotectant transport system ATP-binding protein